VGGSLTRQLMQAIPTGGSILVYGNLSDSQPEVDHRSLVMDDKKVAGFFLGNWLKSAGLLKTLQMVVRVRKLLGHEFVIPIRGKFPLAEAEQAIATYLAGMTAGKVLLIP
jgi:NADPH:quinone reductase-like Zn-dependent oxidoreductase